MGKTIALSILVSVLSLAGGDVAPMELKVENEVKPTLPKHTLKSNYQVVYNQLPSQVDTFSDMFSEGVFYGRLRSNTFYYGWRREGSTRNSHIISGLGGSVVYKSANYANFDFTAGLYYTRAFFNETKDPLNRLKPGKDTLSRFNYANTGDEYMAVLNEIERSRTTYTT